MAEKADHTGDAQRRLLSLAADVGTAVTCCDTLDDMLLQCTKAIVKNCDAAFARIWIYDEEKDVLVLHASGGMYTHLDGPHSRIKVGEYKIGQIAAQRTPVLTNDVQNDPRISDKEWAKREGMVAFAGHPLLVQDSLVGVMGLFSRTPLGEDVAKALAAVADGIALGAHRKQIEKQLRENERVFSEFANNMRDIMWIIVPGQDKPVYVSPAFEHVVGLPLASLYERPALFTDAVVSEDRERFSQFFARTLSEPTGPSDIEYRLQRADGDIRWLWSRAFPTFDAEGHVTQVVGVTHDITEKKEAERRVSEFYSMVSHELRTPLTAIRAALGLIEGGITGSITDETLELISIARTESDRLIRLINDILDMRKMEAGKLQLQVLPIDPQEVLTRTLAAMRSFAQEHGVQLLSWINTDKKMVGDYDRVVQVLTNLLSNAIKFSVQQGEVSVSVEETGSGTVRFSVSDNGPGIPAQQQHKLFELFQQLDSSDSRTKGGTGLGLAISKAIIERLGGTIGFESEVGKGSTFWFELPIARDLLDEYAKSLPGWLQSLTENLRAAREHNSSIELQSCLSKVRKIRGSAEPCGFRDVANQMASIESKLVSLISGDGEVEDAWKSIDTTMQQTLAGPVFPRNNE